MKLSGFFRTEKAPVGELWGYWVSHAETLRWLVVFLIFAVVLLSISTLVAMRKPPVVIRVDGVGGAAIIKDLPVNNQPSDVEITAYSKDFLRAYLEVNSLTVQKDLTRALNMMTKRYQSAHLRELTKDHFLQDIVRANIQSSVEIKSLALTTRTPSRVYVDVRGIISTSPLEDNGAPPTKKGFISKLTLAYVPRTERTPNGILIDDYRQQVVPLEDMLGPDKVLPKDDLPTEVTE